MKRKVLIGMLVILITPISSFALEAGIYRLQQDAGKYQYLDAYRDSNDNKAVTRSRQNDGTQQWVFRKVPNTSNSFEIEQVATGNFLDAYQKDHDFQVVTRTRQKNGSQYWKVSKTSNGNYRLQQASTGRFLDAHTSDTYDFGVVLRMDYQNDGTQEWYLIRD